MKETSIDFLKKNGIKFENEIDLKGGISNSNYLLDFKYVLKEPFETKYSRVQDDTIEFENRLALHFISPKAICYDKEKGLILTEYLKDFKPIDVKTVNLKQIKNIVKNLKIIHNVKLDNLHTLNYEELLDYYRLQLPSEDRIYFSELEDSNVFLGDYEPSHFDLVANNILSSKDYEIKLIDFEFACKAPLNFDLVSLLGENDFSHETKLIIIDLYFGKNVDKKEKFIANYDELLAIADLLWYHWAMARSLNCSKDRKKVFKAIAKEKRTRLFSYISMMNLKKIVKKDDRI